MHINHQFLPHCGPRSHKIRTLVLHCSVHQPQEMIKVLDERQLSAHFVIGTDGEIFQLVPQALRAWHAGESFWRGMSNLNHWSIGIELSSPLMGQSPYPDRQLNSLINLSRQIIRHYQIPATNVVAHSDVAPTRKPDPGKAFPWQYLAQKGVGCWYDLADAQKIKETSAAVLLKQIGYDVKNLPAAAYAFCRHFIPELVATEDNIDTLLEQIYPPEFELPPQYLPILQACAYRYR